MRNLRFTAYQIDTKGHLSTQNFNTYKLAVANATKLSDKSPAVCVEGSPKSELIEKELTLKINLTQKKETHQVVDRTTGATEIFGNYESCHIYLTNHFNCAIIEINKPLSDEDGNSNIIESN